MRLLDRLPWSADTRRWRRIIRTAQRLQGVPYVPGTFTTSRAAETRERPQHDHNTGERDR